MKIRTSLSFLVFTIFMVALAIHGNGIMAARAYPTGMVATPSPIPENRTVKENDSKNLPEKGPVSGQATSYGVSLPVRDLPRASPQTELPPREINPQNTIPIKNVKSSPRADAIPVKKTSKRKPSRR